MNSTLYQFDVSYVRMHLKENIKLKERVLYSKYRILQGFVLAKIWVRKISLFSIQNCCGFIILLKEKKTKLLILDFFVNLCELMIFKTYFV